MVTRATVATVGIEIGTTTDHRVRRWPAPSSSAASSIAVGMVRKNCRSRKVPKAVPSPGRMRSEEHTSELQSRGHLVCRLLLEKKNNNISQRLYHTAKACK